VYRRGRTVSLRPVSRGNVRAVCDLPLADDQRHLVAPPAYTVAEAGYEPGALLRAIDLDDEPVGVRASGAAAGSRTLAAAATESPCSCAAWRTGAEGRRRDGNAR
jgi:hypothetical protein